MFRIFFRKQSMFSRYYPINSKGIIYDADTSISLRMIELITFILEYSSLAEHSKTMSKATGHEELAVVVLGEQTGDVLTKGGAAVADVDGDVEDAAPNDTHKFCLRERGLLEMESADNTCCGT